MSPRYHASIRQSCRKGIPRESNHQRIHETNPLHHMEVEFLLQGIKKKTLGETKDQSHAIKQQQKKTKTKKKTKSSPSYCVAWMSCTDVKCSFTLSHDATISGSPQVTTSAFSPQIALKLSQVLWICWMFSNWSWISLVALHWSSPQAETPLPPRKRWVEGWNMYLK